MTLPTSVDKATKEYLSNNDPIGEFAKWYMSQNYHLTYMLATEFYDKFKNWCVSSCLSGLNITDNKFRNVIRQYGFVFDTGTNVGIEDIYVYSPDYKEDSKYNPNIEFYDCSNCTYCLSNDGCLHCIKKEIFDTKDTTLNVPELLKTFYDSLPDNVKDKFNVSKGLDVEELEL